MVAKGKLIVVAIGGNSLIVDPTKRTVEDQYRNCLKTCQCIVHLMSEGYKVLITHGNGPQVGFIMRRAELASHELHMVPLDSCVADTQGAIGYNIQRGMYNYMREWEKRKNVVTVVTQVLVDKNDPAFKNPSKPIGLFMDKKVAEQRKKNLGWDIAEDSGRGYRRVVSSPRPVEIIEIDSIIELLKKDYVVVAAGGGGIPVYIDEEGSLTGAIAVIDKDLVSSMLAVQVNADILLISTQVEKVFLNYGTPDEKSISKMTVSEAKQYIKEGHFKPGSMLPKIEAMVEFVEKTGKKAVITDPLNLTNAIHGKTGTWIVADEEK